MVFPFLGVLQSSWILGMRRRGNFVACFGTLGIFQCHPLQVSEVCPLCVPKLSQLELDGSGFAGMFRSEAEPSLVSGVRRGWSCLGSFPSPGSGVGASALGLGMLRTWEPSLLYGIFPALLWFPPHLSQTSSLCSTGTPRYGCYFFSFPFKINFSCWYMPVMNIWLSLGWVLLFSSFFPLLVSRELCLSSVPEMGILGCLCCPSTSLWKDTTFI